MPTWEEHWADGNIPWDAGESSPALLGLTEQWTQNPDLVRGRRALVPGCGSGYDVFTLARAGFEAVGLDIAPSALERFETLRREADLMPHQAHLLTADFFNAPLSDLGGPYDFIWDYTFYCAIDIAQRPAWKARMLSLLAPGGTLATLLFPVDPSRAPDDGPPFPLDPNEVKAQLEPELVRSSLFKVPESHPGREGKEYLALWNAK